MPVSKIEMPCVDRRNLHWVVLNTFSTRKLFLSHRKSWFMVDQYSLVLIVSYETPPITSLLFTIVDSCDVRGETAINPWFFGLKYIWFKWSEKCVHIDYRTAPALHCEWATQWPKASFYYELPSEMSTFPVRSWPSSVTSVHDKDPKWSAWVDGM